MSWSPWAALMLRWCRHKSWTKTSPSLASTASDARSFPVTLGHRAPPWGAFRITCTVPLSFRFSPTTMDLDLLQLKASLQSSSVPA
jgi:hypothetical protein